MSEDYHEVWRNLGLDLQAHDSLLGALGAAYRDIFLSQHSRPGAMAYFDSFMGEVHGLRVKELIDAKAEGRKVIGSFCVFVPEEMIVAVGGISVGLCAGAEFAFDEAEKMLPRNTCALIKSVFGFKLGRVCPYIEASDMIVGENTCDGKKKSYELLGDLVSNLHVMDLPQMKSEAGKALLKAEYGRFATALESLAGNKMTVEKLRRGIRIVNDKRKAIKRLNDLRKVDPAPLSGLDALLINQIFFFDDPVRFTKNLNELCDELENRVRGGQGISSEGHTRILVTGCPMAIPNWKLPWIVESSGGVIVGEESCVGERGARWLTEESGDSVDEIIDRVVDRYFNIDCAIFTPNPSRLEHITEMARAYRAQGVIHYCLQFCQPYQMESASVENKLEKENIPALRIDTDYSQEDTGQIKTRVEAFIEMLKNK